MESTVPPPYERTAQTARDAPGSWVCVREGLASANLVTQIRADKIKPFPSGEFQAKSERNGDKYSVHVRYVPPGSFDSRKIAEDVVSSFLPEFGRLMTEMLVEYGNRIHQAKESESRMVTVVLDVCYADDETMDEALNNLVAGIEANWKVLQEHGPGGGWPVVEFTGTETAIYELNRRYLGNGPDTMELKELNDTVSRVSD